MKLSIYYQIPFRGLDLQYAKVVFKTNDVMEKKLNLTVFHNYISFSQMLNDSSYRDNLAHTRYLSLQKLFQCNQIEF